jgi:hypothetical protein
MAPAPGLQDDAGRQTTPIASANFLDDGPLIDDGDNLDSELSDLPGDAIAVVVIGQHDRPATGPHAVQPSESLDAARQENAR